MTALEGLDDVLEIATNGGHEMIAGLVKQEMLHRA